MSKITEQFIRKIPKTDLHLHLDGSLRLSSLIEMARDGKVELPSYEADGLNALVFKERYADLTEYLTGFAYTVGVLQTFTGKSGPSSSCTDHESAHHLVASEPNCIGSSLESEHGVENVERNYWLAVG